MKEMINMLKERYAPNEPIFTEDVFALCEGAPRSTVYYQLRKAVQKGEIAKAERGVYYIPTRTLLGKSVLPSLKPLVKKYISDGEEVQGYWGGLMLENQEGLTTQNPTVLEIVTNKATRRLRRLGARAGYRDVLIRPPRVEVTKANVEALKFLDLITALPERVEQETIGELEGKAKKLDARIVLLTLGSYPAKTSKKLVESGLLNVFA